MHKRAEQSKIIYLAQKPIWIINNANFCYEGNSSTNNDNEEKQHFLKKNKKIPKNLTWIDQ